jgi:hypothetical protein
MAIQFVQDLICRSASDVKRELAPTTHFVNQDCPSDDFVVGRREPQGLFNFVVGALSISQQESKIGDERPRIAVSVVVF